MSNKQDTKDSPLVEAIRKLVKESLDESGPIGYLSKTKRPDPRTAWDPEKQKQWAQQNAPETINPRGTTGMGPIGSKPGEPTQQPSPDEPTNPGTAGNQRLLGLTAAISKASSEQLQQIWQILGNQP